MLCIERITTDFLEIFQVHELWLQLSVNKIIQPNVTSK